MGWLSGLSDELHDRLAPIVEPRTKATKTQLGAFVASQLKSQASELKASSQTVYANVEANLTEFFGSSRDIATITAQDARDFRAWLEEKGSRPNQGPLAPNTVRKRTGICKTLFAAAVDEGLVARNPFAKLPSTVRPNAEREFYLDLARFDRLLKVVADPDWRAILLLARLASFRIPSEAAALEWQAIDFAKKQILVFSSKTERKKPVRIAPMVARVEEALQAVERREVRVFPWLAEDTNMRTQLLKYIKRAELEPWPKLWQNLRTSAATDFARICPAHVAAKICGHTVQVARAFYWQVTDSDISDAREKLGGLAGGLKSLHSSAPSGTSKTAKKGQKKASKPKKS